MKISITDTVDKTDKLAEIKQDFADEFKTRVFTSSLGFPVDNRRSGDKFDKDNVESLIALNQEPVDFKDADGNIHSLTLSNLQTLKTEMIQDGLSIYQKKWALEAQINNATTIDELKAITW